MFADFDCGDLVALVLFLFPFFGHQINVWLSLLLTYCFSPKNGHPSYCSVALFGGLSWIPFLATRYHQRRALGRRAEQEALQMAARVRLQTNMLQNTPEPTGMRNNIDNTVGGGARAFRGQESPLVESPASFPGDFVTTRAQVHSPA